MPAKVKVCVAFVSEDVPVNLVFGLASPHFQIQESAFPFEVLLKTSELFAHIGDEGILKVALHGGGLAKTVSKKNKKLN